jgi:hypothetical protein
MLLRFIHSRVGRAARLALGFFMLVQTTEHAAVAGFLLAVGGTVIAATGLANVCPAEEGWNAMRTALSHRHHRHPAVPGRHLPAA